MATTTLPPVTLDMSLTITPGYGIPRRAVVTFRGPDDYARVVTWESRGDTTLGDNGRVWCDHYRRTLTDAEGSVLGAADIEVRTDVAVRRDRPAGAGCDYGPLTRAVAEYVRDSLPTVLAVVAAG